MSRSTSQAGGRRPRAARPARPLAALALLALAALVAGLAVAGSGGRHAHAPAALAGRPSVAGGSRRAATARAPRGRPVDVSAGLAASAPAVRPDFLGLSFEVGELPRIAGWADHGDLVNLMRALGPGVMRFGGVSAEEQATWASVQHPLPQWAGVAITAKDFAGLARLAQATGWKVLMTLNLSHPDAARAAEEAAAAKAALGPSLIGFALGNEPDQYVHRRLRTASWSQSAYRRQVAALRSAVAAAAPGVPFAGPDAASGVPGLPWVRGEAGAVRPSMLTDHFYPSSSCGYTPAVSDLLAASTRTIETGMLGALAHISRVVGVPLRLDETNNISCRGQPGVSDSFASALWAVDYITRAIHAGLPGINFHDLVGETRTYSPLAAASRSALDSGALQAKPEYYALLLARTLLGDQPLATRVTGAGSGLTAMALLGPQGELHLVLVDFDPAGSTPLRVRLRVPSRFGPGPILRLTGPSPAALSGVRLGGQRVAPDGTWSPEASLPLVYGAPGALELSMPPSSAALVTLKSSG